MGVTPFTGKLQDEMLRVRRQYFIKEVKAPMRKAAKVLITSKHSVWRLFHFIVFLYKASKYLEPTRENCRKVNSLVLLDIWDKFMEYEDNPSPKCGTGWLFRTLRKLSVGTYEHDSYYAQRMDWWVEQLNNAYVSGKWKPQTAIYPYGCWKEPSVLQAKKELLRRMEETVGIKDGER